MKRLYIFTIMICSITAMLLIPVSAAVPQKEVLFTTGYNNEFSKSVASNGTSNKSKVDWSVWDQAEWYNLKIKEGNFSDDELSARMKSVLVCSDDNYIGYCFLIEVNQAERLNTYNTYTPPAYGDNTYTPSKNYPANYGDQDCVEIFFEELASCRNTNLGQHHAHKQVRFNIAGITSPINPNAKKGDNYQNMTTYLLGNRYSVIKTETGYLYHILMSSYMSYATEFLDYIEDDFPLALDVVVKAVKSDGSVLKLHSSVDIDKGEKDPGVSADDYKVINYNNNLEYKYKANYIPTYNPTAVISNTTYPKHTNGTTSGKGDGGTDNSNNANSPASDTGDVSDVYYALFPLSLIVVHITLKTIKKKKEAQ